MARKSVMTHQFSKAPQAQIPRSSFNRSHGLKTTFDAGYLVPIFVDEALPGDTFNVRMTGFARLATMIHPVMDNLRMETFFFAVPKRLVWENWPKFCGEQTDPGDSIDFTIPTLSATTPLTGSLHDYMGLPIVGGAGITPVSLPFRAYNLIWNEWFRDQNLQDSVTVPKTNGPDAPALFELLRRGKRHDYFSSCLPWPQKGDSVDLPLGTKARVTADTTTTEEVDIWSTDQSGYRQIDAGLTANEFRISGLAGVEADSLYADLTNATAATINQLRQAFQIQKLLERDARGGTRYTEIIRSHFGVTSPDARLQRPEFLGGGSSPVVNSVVPNTSATATEDQGELAGYGTVVLDGHGFQKSFTEHCVLIGLVSVRADLTYQQGLERMWSRSTRYDVYWPALSHIGEQAVLNKEIFTQAIAADESVFGYQERYAEYRYKPSRITGLFRSDAVGSLDVWHLSQDFAALPVLDDTFIQDNPPIDRVIAVPTEPHFLFDAYFNMRCARPMPLYGVPGLIDHF